MRFFPFSQSSPVRYRAVPTFGCGTIRRFHNNVSGILRIFCRYVIASNISVDPLNPHQIVQPPSVQCHALKACSRNRTTNAFFICFSTLCAGTRMLNCAFTQATPSPSLTTQLFLFGSQSFASWKQRASFTARMSSLKKVLLKGVGLQHLQQKEGTHPRLGCSIRNASWTWWRTNFTPLATTPIQSARVDMVVLIYHNHAN
jgi:hypothetical protein